MQTQDATMMMCELHIAEQLLDLHMYILLLLSKRASLHSECNEHSER
jgi:hypothetical protein